MAKHNGKQIRSIQDLSHDDKNANRGTERGGRVVAESLRQFGAGRSVLADKHGRLIAGNKTADQARALGLEVVVVPSDGKKLVIVQRTDLDLHTDKAARELAIADNRAGELSLEWDLDVLTELEQDLGVNLELVGFTEGELRELEAAQEKHAEESSGDEDSHRKMNGFGGQPVVKVAIAVKDLAEVERALVATGNLGRADALLDICRHYLESHGETEGQLDAAAQSGAEDGSAGGAEGDWRDAGDS